MSADCAFLPSTMHILNTASRRTGRGDVCASLGCADVLKTCSAKWKEGVSDAPEITQHTRAQSVTCMDGSMICMCLTSSSAASSSSCEKPSIPRRWHVLQCIHRVTGWLQCFVHHVTVAVRGQHANGAACVMTLQPAAADLLRRIATCGTAPAMSR